MESATRTIPAAQFRDRCLKLLDEVHATGEKLIVTKHGRPVAAVVPAVASPATNVIGWSNDIHLGTDLTEPAVPPEDWHIVSDPERVLTGSPSKDAG
ncbi:MAG: type II toxin-antitoxin system prevent-host-death family antitoxin [bacterium]|nr:type II toxin-antitoxin system prevent-host-death family antitoxin [bacterium]MDE0287112.1 type II toxin-antitoxin system prevent-host-death family antitoxin [bacterium]MDE0439973.1 type II toxin-antitoxin system prevent-host-death family antitoxin [bacterium]